MAPPEVIAEARRLFALGYQVIAVRADKRPWGKDWRRIHTEAEVVALLEGSECVAIGFLGGELNYWIVPIDFDNPAGDEWFRTNCRLAGLDPDDFPTVLTSLRIQPDGSQWRGRHRYMSDRRHVLGNSAGPKLAAMGIDIRGNGFCVLPPSPHASGSKYEWDKGHSLDDFPEGVPPVPDFLYAAIEERRQEAPQEQEAEPPPSGAGFRAHGPTGSAGASRGPSYETRIKAYLEGAIEKSRGRLAAVTSPGRNAALNNEALGLGHWAHHGVYNEGQALSALMAACDTNGLLYDKDNGGTAKCHKTFWSGWKKGLTEPKELPDDEPPRPHFGASQERTYHSKQSSENTDTPGSDKDEAKKEDAKQSENANYFNDFDLMDKEFPKLQWIIEEWLPTGLALLVGAPKIGKSWLAMDLVTEVASGRHVFGKPTNQCSTLYIALEDPPRRLQARMRKILADHEPTGRTEFFTKWPALDGGGLDQLKAYLADHPDCRLVVIDTFAKVRAKPDGKSGVYQQDYQDIGLLQTFANEHGIALVLVHHTRKQDATDALDTISGSNAIAGAADTIMVLKRRRNETLGLLTITGRDIVEDGEFSINFDRETCKWSVLGLAAKVQAETAQQKVYDLLLASSEPLSPKDISEDLQIPASTAKMALRRLQSRGSVVKISRGKWGIAGRTYE